MLREHRRHFLGGADDKPAVRSHLALRCCWADRRCLFWWSCLLVASDDSRYDFLACLNNYKYSKQIAISVEKNGLRVGKKSILWFHALMYSLCTSHQSLLFFPRMSTWCSSFKSCNGSEICYLHPNCRIIRSDSFISTIAFTINDTFASYIPRLSNTFGWMQYIISVLVYGIHSNWNE